MKLNQQFFPAVKKNLVSKTEIAKSLVTKSPKHLLTHEFAHQCHSGNIIKGRAIFDNGIVDWRHWFDFPIRSSDLRELPLFLAEVARTLDEMNKGPITYAQGQNI